MGRSRLSLARSTETSFSSCLDSIKNDCAAEESKCSILTGTSRTHCSRQEPGLKSVNTVLAELDEEIKALGSLLDRRSKGEIWLAIDQFTGAITSKKADMIIPDHYLAAESARDDAIASRLKVDERLRELRARRNFLERGRRVAPILAALRTLRSNLNEFVGVPDLPEEFSEAWKKADDDVRLANEAITRNRAEVEKLQEQLRAMPPESPIIGYEETINALTERLGKFLGDQDDLPKLARRIVRVERPNPERAAVAWVRD